MEEAPQDPQHQHTQHRNLGHGVSGGVSSGETAVANVDENLLQQHNCRIRLGDSTSRSKLADHPLYTTTTRPADPETQGEEGQSFFARGTTGHEVAKPGSGPAHDPPLCPCGKRARFPCKSGIPHPERGMVESRKPQTSLASSLGAPQDLPVDWGGRSRDPNTIRRVDTHSKTGQETTKIGTVDTQGRSSSVENKQALVEALGGELLVSKGDATRGVTGTNSSYIRAGTENIHRTLARLLTIHEQYGWSASAGKNHNGKQVEDGEVPHNFGEVPQHGCSAPIYAPVTRKVSLSEYETFLSESEFRLIQPWIQSAEWYTSLLRRQSKKTRPMFKNVVPTEDLQILLNAGIIEEAGQDSRNGDYVKLFFVEEKQGTRRRVIFETRAINQCIRIQEGILQKSWLPHLPEIMEFVVTSKKQRETRITAIDFKSFYYQLLLDPSVRKFFGVSINGRNYQLRVVPQGASMSVLIAQTISTAVARAYKAQSSLVYIDNIYLLNRPQNSKTFGIPFEVGFEETYNGESTIKILGVVANLQEGTMDVDQRLRQKMQELCDRRCWTVRDVLSAFGSLLYIGRVLHVPMCENAQTYQMMKDLAMICRAFLLGEVNLHESVEKKLEERMKRYLRIGVQWEPARFCHLLREEENWFEVWSDASAYGGAYVVFHMGGVEIRSWNWEKWQVDTSINFKELYACAAACEWIANNYGNTARITLMLDSQVAVMALLNGYSRSGSLNKILEKILCTTANSFYVKWIPSNENVADGPSRGLPTPKQLERPTFDVASVTMAWYGGAWRPRQADSGKALGMRPDEKDV